jgi:hypothetical protein
MKRHAKAVFETVLAESWLAKWVVKMFRSFFRFQPVVL